MRKPLNYKRRMLLLVTVAVVLLLSIRATILERDRQELMSASMLGLSGIRSGLEAYLAEHGTFPPSVPVRDGGPSSWRKAIAIEARKYVDENFEIPFAFENSNLGLRLSGMTNFVGVVGDDMIFAPSNTPTALDEVTDGIDNTIVVLETHFPTFLWHEPGDLRFSELPSWYEAHRRREPGMLFADGYYAWMTSKMPYEALVALFTKSGQESITRSTAIELGYIDTRRAK